MIEIEKIKRTKKERFEFIEKINSKKTQRELNLRTKIKNQEWFFSFSEKLPEDWLEVNFMDVTWLITCGVAKRPTYVESGIPFLSAQNCRPFKTNLNKVKYISEKEFRQLTVGGKPERNDLLYTRVGNCGEAAKIKYDFDFGVYVSLTLIKPIHELIDSDYLVAFLNGYYGRQQSNVGAIGIGLKNLNVDNVRKYRIPLPPKPIQQAIVSKIEELFSELDKGIENLRMAQQQLKTYRQSVLKWAFEGKLTNRNVIEGELPEGWYIAMVGDISEVFIGSTPKRNTPEYWGGAINWLSSGEIAFCNITSTKETITKKGLENTSCKVHPIGTVIIAMIGEGKTRGQAAILKIEASHNQNTAALRVDNQVYKSELLYYYLVLKYEENRKIGSGNNQKALNKERVKSILIPVPLIEEQQKILMAIESRLTVVDKMEEGITQSLQQAEALRQSILKKAFEGKLI